MFIPKGPDFIWPRAGVGVALETPFGYLLMRRAAGKTAAGDWGFPGGALEAGESLIDCAARETLEEAGVMIRDAVILPLVTEDIFVEAGEHWLTHYVHAYTDETPVNREPHKCDGLMTAWPDEMPHPLFAGIDQLFGKGLLRNYPSDQIRI